ncbi:metal-dependent hydrolase family protein [Kordiimonas pumila]|uniref:Amidohydrolase family protein n=1 Tax=Kordiimonas pumila TaxID=2161677 RepID=A0ABV7D4B8_9PROT|nr:amidohydrolase family protein [Kordiimonas pumila]
MSCNNNTLYLKNVQIFDGEHNRISTPSTIEIEDGKFRTVTENEISGDHTQSIDLTGKFIIPGLIDAHFHAYASDLDFSKLEQMPDTYHALKGSNLLTAALKRGFTTVRDVGGADYGLWKSLEEGLFEGPRLIYAGHALSQTGGHGDTRQPSMEPCACGQSSRLSKVVDGVDNVRKAAREELRRGASHIKVFVSGGISSPSDPVWSLQYSDEELEAIVDEATRRGAYVVAHAYTPEAIERSVRAGIRSIEHGNLITQEVAEYVSSKGAFVVPTLVTYDAMSQFGAEAGAPATLLEKLGDVAGKGLEAIRLCRQAGVKLGFGTDLLGELHQYQRQELILRSQIETPFEVLHSATSVNAELVHMSGRIGVIAEGAFADFLILNSNPLDGLESLANGTSIEGIYKAGQLVG